MSCTECWLQPRRFPRPLHWLTVTFPQTRAASSMGRAACRPDLRCLCFPEIGCVDAIAERSCWRRLPAGPSLSAEEAQLWQYLSPAAFQILSHSVRGARRTGMDVRGWLQQLGLERCADAFAANDRLASAQRRRAVDCDGQCRQSGGPVRDDAVHLHDNADGQ